ncbi:TetR/AcrR family transcriptional regulator [Geosporobacter ferrireducens]|uniref:HTH tetR-type domain-containing protein n=1 Tax=Geosporobacter ferrireducens TaxID=1424294 RepID=A0A1D8GIJ6_9FIRM|nr:TetR/AcrR family transcriptional regulator [Geosporobacter ferrireducens]AOT70745.1 hypothetical protein Gferi_14865 [Geosporobacter ferrireducens]MTI57551.1 TetR/AcrR family transcriptional regulator [Geosporobacter ferrireducens]
MQYKKDEVKEKIDFAALEVFAEKGYTGTKIADIAEKAGVSIGNIYRYYKSKEEIFYTNIPESFPEELKKLLKDKIVSSKHVNLQERETFDEFWLVNEEVITFMVKKRLQILIVLHKGKGTRYENTKEELVDFLLEEVKSSDLQQGGHFCYGKEGSLLLKILYENLIDMTLRIIENTRSIEETRQCLQWMNRYHLFGITKLFQ